MPWWLNRLFQLIPWKTSGVQWGQYLRPKLIEFRSHINFVLRKTSKHLNERSEDQKKAHLSVTIDDCPPFKPPLWLTIIHEWKEGRNTLFRSIWSFSTRSKAGVGLTVSRFLCCTEQLIRINTMKRNLNSSRVNQRCGTWNIRLARLTNGKLS